MDLKETYNKLAQEWHKDHQTDDWWQSGTNAFINFLKPHDLVLDVGCGGGTKSKYLIQKGLRVFGIDISENMIEIAKREVPDGKFTVMNLTDVAELQETFDGIFMQAVLLHIPRKDVSGVLNTIVSKLKNGGYLYIAVKEKRPGGVGEEVKVEDDYGYEYKRFFSYHTIEELKNHLEGVGLTVVFTESNTPKSKWISIIGKK